MVFIGIGVAIGLTICRRGTTVPMHDGPDDFTTPTYVPALRVEPRSRYGTDRRRSQRTSLYIEESRNGKVIFYSKYKTMSYSTILNICALKSNVQSPNWITLDTSKPLKLRDIVLDYKFRHMFTGNNIQ